LLFGKLSHQRGARASTTKRLQTQWTQEDDVDKERKHPESIQGATETQIFLCD